MSKEYKQDYKRTYTTFDNVAVDPGDEVWVPIYDLKYEEWVPQAMTAKEAEDSNHRIYYSMQDACGTHCEGLNSDD